MAAVPETTQHDTALVQGMDSVTLEQTPFTGSLEDAHRLKKERDAAPTTTLRDLKRTQQHPARLEGAVRGK